MADPSRHPGTGEAPGRGSTTGTPRWVKVFAIIAAVLVLLLLVLLLSGGRHGPGRHLPSGGLGDPTPPAAARAL
jgi:hypothetical protein